jgi:hypothetical protein
LYISQHGSTVPVEKVKEKLSSGYKEIFGSEMKENLKEAEVRTLRKCYEII